MGTYASNFTAAIRPVVHSLCACFGTSVIVNAIDRVIELKNGGMNITTANLSFGTFALNTGQEALDIVVDGLLAAGIIPVVATGNTGPALLTTASPASSFGSIAVGAGSLAHQERIAADTLASSGLPA